MSIIELPVISFIFDCVRLKLKQKFWIMFLKLRKQFNYQWFVIKMIIIAPFPLFLFTRATKAHGNLHGKVDNMVENCGGKW